MLIFYYCHKGHYPKYVNHFLNKGQILAQELEITAIIVNAKGMKVYSTMTVLWKVFFGRGEEMSG